MGKTTVVSEFGRGFDNYLYFNLEHKSDRALFEQSVSLSVLIDQLFLYHHLQRKPGETLIFIDEIQNSPMAVTFIKSNPGKAR